MIDTELPDSSRVWIFALERRVSPDLAQALLTSLSEFCREWKAHGAALQASVEVVDRQIIVIATSDQGAQASGCSIDLMNRVVTESCSRLNLNLVDPGAVLVNLNGELRAMTRSNFKQLFSAGEITDETRVVDTTIANLGDFRAGKLCPRVGESWHAKLIRRCGEAAV